MAVVSPARRGGRHVGARLLRADPAAAGPRRRGGVRRDGARAARRRGGSRRRRTPRRAGRPQPRSRGAGRAAHGAVGDPEDVGDRRGRPRRATAARPRPAAAGSRTPRPAPRPRGPAAWSIRSHSACARRCQRPCRSWKAAAARGPGQSWSRSSLGRSGSRNGNRRHSWTISTWATNASAGVLGRPRLEGADELQVAVLHLGEVPGLREQALLVTEAGRAAGPRERPRLQPEVADHRMHRAVLGGVRGDPEARTSASRGRARSAGCAAGGGAGAASPGSGRSAPASVRPTHGSRA